MSKFSFSVQTSSTEMGAKLLYFALLVCTVSAGKHDIYRRHSVHGVKIRDVSDQRFLQQLQISLDVDVWQPGTPERRDAEVMVAPNKTDAFFNALDERGLVHYLKIADVADRLEEHDQEIDTWKRSRTNRMVFQDYPRYAEIDAYLERIAATYPDIVTLVNAGPSYEGRPVKYLRISTTNFMDPSKPVYVMDAMMHAREWVTTPVTLYSIHRLVENLRSEERDVLEDVDWIILPLVNPDGYEFSHTTQRLWRKTRSVLADTTCLGSDINRNFDANFNTIGVSTNPCSDIYPGPEAFSEPETRYIRDILLQYRDRIQLYNDIHSHGNYITFGFGNTVLPSNTPQLHHVAAAWGAKMDTMKRPQADFYLVGNSALLMYETSGCGQDYATGLGIPFPYTLELPGYGYGFLVPPEYMDHVNEETWQGIVVTARLSSIYYRSRYFTTTSTTSTTTTPTTTTPTTTTPTTTTPTTTTPTTTTPTTTTPTTTTPTTTTSTTTTTTTTTTAPTTTSSTEATTSSTTTTTETTSPTTTTTTTTAPTTTSSTETTTSSTTTSTETTTPTTTTSTTAAPIDVPSNDFY